MINNARLAAPKNQENFAMLFHSLLRLKTKPQEIIATPRFNNATSAERPWIKPMDVGESPGISVGNIAKRKAPTQKIPRVILLVFDALMFRVKATSSNETPVASDKNAVVISQLKLPTAYSLTKQDIIFLSGLIAWRRITIAKNSIVAQTLIIGMVLLYFIKFLIHRFYFQVIAEVIFYLNKSFITF